MITTEIAYNLSVEFSELSAFNWGFCSFSNKRSMLENVSTKSI